MTLNDLLMSLVYNFSKPYEKKLDFLILPRAGTIYLSPNSTNRVSSSYNTFLKLKKKEKVQHTLELEVYLPVN